MRYLCVFLFCLRYDGCLLFAIQQWEAHVYFSSKRNQLFKIYFALRGLIFHRKMKWNYQYQVYGLKLYRS